MRNYMRFIMTVGWSIYYHLSISYTTTNSTITLFTYHYFRISDHLENYQYLNHGYYDDVETHQ